MLGSLRLVTFLAFAAADFGLADSFPCWLERRGSPSFACWRGSGLLRCSAAAKGRSCFVRSFTCSDPRAESSACRSSVLHSAVAMLASASVGR